MADTDQIILVATIVTAGSTIIAQQQESKSSFKPVIGGWIMGFVLMIVAMFADDLARAFAILIMITALLINGEKVFTVINKSIGKQPPVPGSIAAQTAARQIPNPFAPKG